MGEYMKDKTSRGARSAKLTSFLSWAALSSALVVGMTGSVQANAQEASQGSPVNEANGTAMLTLPANTEVILRLTDELTSKGNANKAGQVFRLVVAYDVKVQGRTVIPSGTMATGEVTKRTGKGVFGKSGKLEVEMRNIDLNGQRIPVVGNYKQEGEGNTLAAVGAVFVAAGLLFVTGKSAVIPRGREFTAYTVATTTVPAL
jgi:hypothetical protein